MAKLGYYEGKHYTEYVDVVKKLKRDGKYESAISLLLNLVDVVEQEAKIKKWSVAPWYYEQMAIIYRKIKDYEAEVSILERFAKVNTGENPLLDRLEKARALL